MVVGRRPLAAITGLTTRCLAVKVFGLSSSSRTFILPKATIFSGRVVLIVHSFVKISNPSPLLVLEELSLFAPIIQRRINHCIGTGIFFPRDMYKTNFSEINF